MLVRTPDFLVVGTSRGGTTSLGRYLAQEPGVFFLTHEVHYFTYAFGRQHWRSYLELFKDARPGQLCGEKSPSYFWFPKAAERIASRLPEAKIICTLREPAQRAVSDAYSPDSPYRGCSPEQLMQVFRNGIDQLVRGRLVLKPFDPSAIIWKGLYTQHIKAYQRYFPQDRLKFISFRKLGSDPAEVVSSIGEFLGVKFDENAMPHINQSHQPELMEGVTKLCDALSSFYASDWQKTCEIAKIL